VNVYSVNRVPASEQRAVDLARSNPARDPVDLGPRAHEQPRDLAVVGGMREVEARADLDRAIDPDRLLERDDRLPREDRDHTARDRVARAGVLHDRVLEQAAERWGDRDRDQAPVLGAVLVTEMALRGRGLIRRERRHRRGGNNIPHSIEQG